MGEIHLVVLETQAWGDLGNVPDRQLHIPTIHSLEGALEGNLDNRHKE